jgi:hypothetical protein
MKRILILAALSAAAMGTMGCGAGDGEANASLLAMFQKSGPKIPAGTQFPVRLTTPVSTETAQAGDPWEGTLAGSVTVDGEVVASAGSVVRGQVQNVLEAKKGDRAMLDLQVTSIEIAGKAHELTAETDPVIAGSPRARNLGAIAGGAAAGALIGKAVGGDGKDAAAGAIIGGAAATAGVAASKGYQVVLKNGTELVFTVK